MYYGGYTPAVHQSATVNPDVGIDVQAWMLGDKLQALEFKNYAMECLYAQHVSGAKTFTPTDVDYAFSKTAPESKLRLFYKHLLAAYISQPERARGGPLQWFSLLKDHEQLGLFFMAAMMSGAQEKPRMHKLEYYKFGKKVGPDVDAQSKGTGAVVPAKRKADEVAVKDEPGK